MAAHEIQTSSTTEGLPLSPSLAPSLQAAHVSQHGASVDARVLVITAAAVAVAICAGFIAQGLTRLIGFFTNLAFYERFSTEFVSPADNTLGWRVVIVPVLGGIIVGLMARFGSKAIRGHGIPEAMEQVLQNRSRIPARMVVLKPLSAAVSIGTGGPFGAEGPIIATGGALGSLVGQLMRTTANERKTLLAAGAAAGMAATFGSPVSAVLLAIELLLFEYRPRSLVPVSLAAAAATGVRIAYAGSAPVFAMPLLAQPSPSALASYVMIGAVVGVASVFVTRAVYAIEDAFERLPIHWMWWPALGGIGVGVVGYFAPKTLGVGYDNIDQILSNHLVTSTVITLCMLKFVSWSVALGSGTSGGTLAPLLTLGAGLGAVCGSWLTNVAPHLGVDPKIAALVGMAAMFAGASRALLASVVFAFETTRQPMGLLPLLGACSTGFLVSCMLMRNSIMTEKIERRGVRALAEYSADFLDSLRVRDCGLRRVVMLPAEQSVEVTLAWLASHAIGSNHQGFPIVSDDAQLVGMITRKDLFDAPSGDATLRELVSRAPVVIFEDRSLRDAADLMACEHIGRLPVVARSAPARVIGILTRSDLIEAHSRRLDEHRMEPGGFSRMRTH